jgi:NDP-sugar pyrophosphorylase family protein
MQALILAGGEGTRLRPLTLNIPKPVVPIANKPFLFWQIQSIKAAGITDITLALNYQPSAIERILGDGSQFGVHLRYLIEPAPFGTAGAYKFAEEAIGETTLVLNGDILTDIDFKKVINQHQENQSTATIVLTPVENPAAYGLVETTKDKNVVRFLEKPTVKEIERLKINTINAGIYVLEPQVLGYIPNNEKYSFEYQLFPQLLANGEKFQAFTADRNYWLDIGTTARYLQANHDALAGKIKNLALNKKTSSPGAAKAEIDDVSIIDSNCIIENGAVIHNSVIGANVVVGERSIIENSVVWADTKIGADSALLNSVTGCACFIESGTQIENEYLADQSVINQRKPADSFI